MNTDVSTRVTPNNSVVVIGGALIVGLVFLGTVFYFLRDSSSVVGEGEISAISDACVKERVQQQVNGSKQVVVAGDLRVFEQLCARAKLEAPSLGAQKAAIAPQPRSKPDNQSER